MIKHLCEEQWARKGVRHARKRCAWKVAELSGIGLYLEIHHFTAMRFPVKGRQWKIAKDDRYDIWGLKRYRVAHQLMCKEAKDQLA